MNNISKHFLGSMALRILSLILLANISIFACKQKPQPVPKPQNKVYYTCSMHPQAHEEHPGNCPICGMKLIKVELTGGNSSAASPDKIVLTAAQIQLAGIQTDTVRDENTGNEKTLTGTVTTDENNAGELSARVAGRVQQLYVRTTGENISPGQPVYSIYSEDIQEAEKEYLLALQQQKTLHNPDVDYGQLIHTAETKLKLWGLSASQVRGLAATGKVSGTTIVLSNISGAVTEIAVHEGDYVTAGMSILKTQSLNNLWVEAQLYAGETNNYTVNDRVSISFPDLGGQVINSKVAFINPELSDESKVGLARISIQNPRGLIRPGMLAYVFIANSDHRLAVPVSAVLIDGKGSKVWVKNADGSFSRRMILAGQGNQSFEPVLSGLKAGEVVVTSGAYLLNSEYIFKKGDDKMDMGNMKM